MARETIDRQTATASKTLEEKVQAARDETPEQRSTVNRAFISYSRRDGEFAERLVEALIRHDIDAWIDLEDIPKSAAWRDEIARGIESANSFVFLLSPSALASVPCNQELEHAVACGKLIVPVVCVDVAPVDTPPEIEKRNWVFLRSTDDFERGIAELVGALTTDLPWVRMHTDLLERAIEWESRGHDKSLALRGSKLLDAEQWQSQAGAGKQPPPTPLHYRLILASRRAQTRRQQTIFGAVSVALVVFIVLAFVALFQRNDAIHQQAIAASRQLDAEAVQVLPTDPELSVLLASAAWKRAQTSFAVETLRIAIPQSHIRKVLRGHTQKVNQVAVDPTGRYAVTTSDDGTARIWNLKTGRTVRILDPRAGPMRGVAWDPKGRYIATSTGNMIRIWNARTGAAVRTLSGHQDVVLTVNFSLDGRYLVSASQDDTARVWAVGDWQQKKVLNHDWQVDDAVFSPNGKDILTATGCPESASCGVAEIWNWRTGRVVQKFLGHLGEVVSAAYGPTGKHVVTASLDGTARVWNVATGQTMAVFQRHVGAVYTAQFSPTGPYVVTAGIDGTARVWDFRTGENFAVLASPTPVNDAIFTPDGSEVITTSDDGAVRLWDADTNQTLHHLVPSGGPQLLNVVTFNRGGNRVATGGTNGFLRIWQVSTGALLSTHKLGSFVNAAAFTPDGKEVITAQDSGMLLQSSARGHGRPEVLLRDSDGAPLNSVSFNRDGRQVLTASNSGTVWILDLATHRLRTCLPGTLAPGGGTIQTGAAALSPDGTYFSMANGDNIVRLWSVATCRPVARLGRHNLRINSVAFSPDGRYLITTSTDGLAKVWDVQARRQVAALASFALGVNSAQFSPNGAYVITGGDDYTARIWRAGTWSLLLELHGALGSVADVTFGPDSQTVATASDDGTARIYRCQVCGSTAHLLSLIPSHVSRGLTAAERQQYLP